jgi:hypothetical protein
LWGGRLACLCLARDRSQNKKGIIAIDLEPKSVTHLF